MDKMIVTVFDDENRAYEGSKTLRELHAEGSITLYEAAVIAKDSRGKVIVNRQPDEEPLGTGLGFATGSLIGLLGGPVGLAVGAVTGTIIGSLADIAELGVSDDFLDEVSQRLSPGKWAVVAEVDEDWITPLDTRMETLGGVVFRRARFDFIDAQIERDIAADRAEIAEMKAEEDKAVGEAKAKLHAKIDAAQKRLQAKRAKLDKKIESIKHEGEAKIKLLKEQAAKAKSERKAKLEKRIVEALNNHEARVDKLKNKLSKAA